jgi:hypothetical protein
MVLQSPIPFHHLLGYHRLGWPVTVLLKPDKSNWILKHWNWQRKSGVYSWGTNEESKIKRIPEVNLRIVSNRHGNNHKTFQEGREKLCKIEHLRNLFQSEFSRDRQTETERQRDKRESALWPRWSGYWMKEKDSTILWKSFLLLES